jgi:hypothetical protein
MTYLQRLKKISESDMAGFVRGLQMPPEFAPNPALSHTHIGHLRTRTFENSASSIT